MSARGGGGGDASIGGGSDSDVGSAAAGEVLSEGLGEAEGLGRVAALLDVEGTDGRLV